MCLSLRPSSINRIVQMMILAIFIRNPPDRENRICDISNSTKSCNFVIVSDSFGSCLSRMGGQTYKHLMSTCKLLQF